MMANSCDIPLQSLHAWYGYFVRHRGKDFIPAKNLSWLKMPTPIIIDQKDMLDIDYLEDFEYAKYKLNAAE